MKLEKAVELIKTKLEGRQYGNEYVSQCPFCESPKHKFYINTDTGMYSCKRASCGAQGNMTTLFKHMGIEEHIEYDNDYEREHKPKAKLNVDMSQIRPLAESDSDIIDYMMSRGISYETLSKCGVQYSKRHNSMVFLTHHNGELVCVLYRTTDKRLFMERGSEQRLWGVDDLNFDNKTLYIAEGHPDRLTLVEMGIENAVSVPNGAASHEWIDRDWDILKKFERIVLCYDNDTAGKKAILEVKNRLDFASLYELEYGNSKDINDMFMENCEGLYKTVRNPKEISMDGFISLQNVTTSRNPLEMMSSSGLAQFDRIFGGMRLHESTIICASSGSGKTTVVSNMIKGFMSVGEKVATWSGELSNAMLKTWIYSAIAGEKAIDKVQNPFRPGEFISTIKPEYEERIDKAVDGKLFVYDGNKSDGFKMLEHFEMLHKRHGVTNFFIDNASILNMTVKGLGKYEGEEAFSQRLAAFTRNNAVRVFIIMHPTKTTINADPNYMDSKGKVKKPERYDQYQVRGSASLVNLAHNILFLVRATEHYKAWYAQVTEAELTKAGRTKEIPDIVKFILQELSLIAYLVKNRGTGNINEDALFGYSPETRRIYGLMSKAEDLSREILEEDVEVDEPQFETIGEYDYEQF